MAFELTVFHDFWTFTITWYHSTAGWFRMATTEDVADTMLNDNVVDELLCFI